MGNSGLCYPAHPALHVVCRAWFGGAAWVQGPYDRGSVALRSRSVLTRRGTHLWGMLGSGLEGLKPSPHVCGLVPSALEGKIKKVSD